MREIMWTNLCTTPKFWDVLVVVSGTRSRIEQAREEDFDPFLTHCLNVHYLEVKQNSMYHV